jgi:hypothetical protein
MKRAIACFLRDEQGLTAVEHAIPRSPRLPDAGLRSALRRGPAPLA